MSTPSGSTAVDPGRGHTPWRDFSRLLGENRNEYVAVTITSCAIGAFEGLIHPLLIKAILDEASLKGDFSRLMYLILGYLALGVSLNVGAYVTSLWQQRLDNRIVRRVSEELLRVFYSERYEDFLRNGVGYYISRIRSDVKDGLVPMLALVRGVAVKISMLVALVIALLYISWKAFAVLAAIIPVATIVSLVVGKRISALTSTEREKEAQVLVILASAVGSLKMVGAFGLTSKTLSSFDRGMHGLLDAGYSRFKVVRTLQGASDLTMVLSDVCSIFVGALFVFQKKMTFGSFIAFMNAFWRAATTLIAIFKNWAELKSYGATVHRVSGFLELRKSSEFKYSESVIADRLSFSFGQTSVLRNVSTVIDRGRRVLVTGDNGSGKTTLANILARHLLPTAGSLSLPARISSSTLPLAFPPLAIKDLGVDAELLKTLAVFSSEILEAYPDQLSAGQQQKVALAMALSKKADLYVLDEPLANLDAGIQRIAMDMIMTITKGKILIMIMHGGSEYRNLFDTTLALESESAGTMDENAVQQA
ncbi:ABC transporter transmembrane domain-containing protein [Stenotrophomonas sp. FR024]|uniref:ABC transporter transmembrane domain-containing protein n=1 Tax=Stenotrophomonas sp. FR024 TaxID=3398460 RepID=UPI0013107389